ISTTLSPISITGMSSFLSLLISPPPRPTLFPYTTLFRSGTESLHDNRLSLRIHSAMVILGRNRYRIFTLRQRRSVIVESPIPTRSEEHTSELQSPYDLVCRLLLEKKKKKIDETLSTRQQV